MPENDELKNVDWTPWVMKGYGSFFIDRPEPGKLADYLESVYVKECRK